VTKKLKIRNRVDAVVAVLGIAEDAIRWCGTHRDEAIDVQVAAHRIATILGDNDVDMTRVEKSLDGIRPFLLSPACSVYRSIIIGGLNRVEKHLGLPLTSMLVRVPA
jgi:hypothetical protein